MADYRKGSLKRPGSLPDSWSEFQQSMLGGSASLSTGKPLPEELKRFYQAEFSYIEQSLNEARCLAIDIETTGLNPE